MSIPGSEAVFFVDITKCSWPHDGLTYEFLSPLLLPGRTARYTKLISCLVSFHREYLRVDRIVIWPLIFSLSFFPVAERPNFGNSSQVIAAILFFFLLNFGDNDSSSQVVEIRLFRFERKRDSNVGLFILDVQSGANRFLSIPQSEKTGFGSNGASLA